MRISLSQPSCGFKPEEIARVLPTFTFIFEPSCRILEHCGLRVQAFPIALRIV
jgi:hypothetical protein